MKVPNFILRAFSAILNERHVPNRMRRTTTPRRAELQRYTTDLAQYKTDLLKYQSDLIKYQKNLNECQAEVQRCRAQIRNHRVEMERYSLELNQHKEQLQRYKTQSRGLINMVNYPQRQAQINQWIMWSDQVTERLARLYGEYSDPAPEYDEAMDLKW